MECCCLGTYVSVLSGRLHWLTSHGNVVEPKRTCQCHSARKVAAAVILYICRLTNSFRLRRTGNEPTTQQRQIVLSQCGLCNSDAPVPRDRPTVLLKGQLRISPPPLGKCGWSTRACLDCGDTLMWFASHMCCKLYLSKIHHEEAVLGNETKGCLPVVRNDSANTDKLPTADGVKSCHPIAP